MTFLKPHSALILSVFRIAVGAAFLQHGTSKYLSLPPTKMSGIDPFSMGGVAGMIELVCGALIVLGLLTRPAAFLASGTMAAAYFIAHFPQNFYPILNGGELALVYCFAFLYISAAGPGPVSLDRMLGRA
ncbi:DoxX family protein [Roseibium sp.]|uniref:DoxX family protein n=1 Tax=Roseibium sp. TaxID=1936156 RepID=UPI003A97B424